MSKNQPKGHKVPLGQSIAMFWGVRNKVLKNCHKNLVVKVWSIDSVVQIIVIQKVTKYQCVYLLNFLWIISRLKKENHQGFVVKVWRIYTVV